jgi:hypothetical protein
VLILGTAIRAEPLPLRETLPRYQIRLLRCYHLPLLPARGARPCACYCEHRPRRPTKSHALRTVTYLRRTRSCCCRRRRPNGTGRRGGRKRKRRSSSRLLLEREDELGQQQSSLYPRISTMAETRAGPDPDGRELRDEQTRAPVGRA